MTLEADRQRGLLAALAQPPGAPTAAGLYAPWPIATGVAAYRRNAAATAERALSAAYPTLQQLLGAASFAALARTAWHRHPPTAGDLALWDGGLAVLIAEAPALEGEPYLADVAAIDWAVHRASFGADTAASTGIDHLATQEPHQLWLELVGSTVLLTSAYPVASIWLAHRRDDAARFDAVRSALAA
ncbi:MAG: DNA-binding domain-containing protein, partial [Pseudomonadota bacterium]|nr:DNA-binding domain-containing protein [Pseudomonadota bacterium]